MLQGFSTIVYYGRPLVSQLSNQKCVVCVSRIDSIACKINSVNKFTQREKLASAHLHSSQLEFWKLVKTISKSSRGTFASSTANMVDGCCDDGEISCIFSSKLESLLNSCLDPQSHNSLYDSIIGSLLVLLISLPFSSHRRRP